MNKLSYEDRLSAIENLVCETNAIIKICSDAMTQKVYCDSESDFSDFVLLFNIAKKNLSDMHNYF